MFFSESGEGGIVLEGEFISLAPRTVQLRSPGDVLLASLSVLTSSIPHFVWLPQKPHKSLESTEINSVSMRWHPRRRCPVRLITVLSTTKMGNLWWWWKNTALTSRGWERFDFRAKYDWLWLGNTCPGYPKFHVPIWWQFYEDFFIFISVLWSFYSKRTKSWIKMLLKHTSGNIREVDYSKAGASFRQDLDVTWWHYWLLVGRI